MTGHFALILHAHLPFVRHPEHERFLEESWFFEALTECYLPLLERLQAWERDRLNARLTLVLSPTLGAMLLDPLLTARYEGRLAGLIELAEREVIRTRWEPARRRLAEHYRERWRTLRQLWLEADRNLVRAFGQLQERRRIEIIPCAATHAVLPLMADHRPSVRGQVLTARDFHRACFGVDPVGFWLPECAYDPAVEPVLLETNLRWFILETHGLLNGSPRPRFGVYAPVFTPTGLAAFARDPDTARQVWSRQGGFPGTRTTAISIGTRATTSSLSTSGPTCPPRTNAVSPASSTTASPVRRVPPSFTSPTQRSAWPGPRHGISSRSTAVAFSASPGSWSARPSSSPPYDAELFGHWWYEGLDFLDAFVRETTGTPESFAFSTPFGLPGPARHPSTRAAGRLELGRRRSPGRVAQREE
ncbi:MAG: DUF1957 domain-containing protein [Verrucomicrobia bacterium]|nr:DUF1957 domain-containing protein [Verrucomicrobiota bacterium]